MKFAVAGVKQRDRYLPDTTVIAPDTHAHGARILIDAHRSLRTSSTDSTSGHIPMRRLVQRSTSTNMCTSPWAELFVTGEKYSLGRWS